MQLELGRDEAARAQKRAADLRCPVAALAVVHMLASVDGAGTKARGVGFHVPIQPPGIAQLLRAVAPLQLRQAVKGRGNRRIHVLQGLPLLRTRQQLVAVAAPSQGAITFQQTVFFQAGTVEQRKIAPVVVVADAVQLHIGVQARQPVGQIGTVAPSVRPAVAVTQPVVGHVAQVQVAVVVALQVTKLRAQHDAALAHHGRGDGGIAVGCDVPVIGLGILHAADAVDTDGGRQQPGLAPIRQRKTHHRHRQDGHALELEHRVVGDAGVGGAIQLHALGLQHPVRCPAGTVVALAGGVGGFVDGRTLAAEKLHALRIAVALGVQKLVRGLGEIALESIDLQLQLRALVDVATPVDVHIALRGHRVVGHGVLGLFGANDGVAPAQLDLALQLGTQIGLALKTVGGQIDRLLAARRGRNVLLQTLAGLQLQRGKWHIPCTGQRLCPCRWQGADQGQQTHGRQRLGKRTDKHGTGMGG